MFYDQKMIDVMSSNKSVPTDACLHTEIAAYTHQALQLSKKSMLKINLQITKSDLLVPALDTAVYDVSAPL